MHWDQTGKGLLGGSTLHRLTDGWNAWGENVSLTQHQRSTLNTILGEAGTIWIDRHPLRGVVMGVGVDQQTLAAMLLGKMSLKRDKSKEGIHVVGLRVLDIAKGKPLRNVNLYGFSSTANSLSKMNFFLRGVNCTYFESGKHGKDKDFL